MEYRKIFQKRGDRYHLAMELCPKCRQEEFLQTLALAEVHEGERVLDIPSGGCYLASYLPKEVELVAVESVEAFYKECRDVKTVLVERFDELPFERGSFDKAISLAGIHHMQESEKYAFYGEIKRVLRREGVFILADVYEGSRVAVFLNDFVDRYNPMGHRGIFLGEHTLQALRSVGFEQVFGRVQRYHWKFRNKKEMHRFLTNLFGLENVTEQELFLAVKEYLGLMEQGEEIWMNWELFFIRAEA